MNSKYGAIKYSDAEAIGAMLVFKMGGEGYAPSEWVSVIQLMGKLPEVTVTGSVIHIEDGAKDVPIKSWVVELGVE